MKRNFYPFRFIYTKNDNCKSDIFFRRSLFIASFILLIFRTASVAQPLSVLFTTPGSYVWICPTGVTSVTVECWGGGGAGGGALEGPNDTVGGGGGGGAYVIDTLSVVPNTYYYLFVAAGGDGVPGDNGNSGDSSWFSSPGTVMAVGGAGGLSGGSGVEGYGAGGAGGAAALCIPTTNAISGSNGSAAFNNGAPFSGGGGHAGGNMGGSGAKGVGGISGSNTAFGDIGNDGGPPGGGGSGGLAGYVISTPFGGFGAAGQVIVSYTYTNPVVNFQASSTLHAKAFPNPTNEKATVEFNNEVFASYIFKVFDMTGRELINKNGKTKEGINNIGLDMSSYAKGIYMIHLQSSDESQVIKLVVQ